MYYSTVSSDVDQPMKAREFWCTVEKACYLEMNPVYTEFKPYLVVWNSAKMTPCCTAIASHGCTMEQE